MWSCTSAVSTNRTAAAAVHGSKGADTRRRAAVAWIRNTAFQAVYPLQLSSAECELKNFGSYCPEYAPVRIVRRSDIAALIDRNGAKGGISSLGRMTLAPAIYAASSWQHMALCGVVRLDVPLCSMTFSTSRVVPQTRTYLCRLFSGSPEETL